MTSNRNILSLTKKVFSDWNGHDDARWGASLAFYTILSLSPLLALAVAVSGLIFDRSDAMRQISGQMEGMVGSAGAQAISAALESTQKSSAHGVLATLVSLLVVLFSASGAFTELRSALNAIWDVEPESSGGIGSMIRDRFFSFGMVLAVAFLLLVSLLLSALLAALSTFMGGLIPIPKVLAGIIDLIVSTAIIAFVFALTFRYVPRTGAEWPQAWKGGLLTSILFVVGKYAVGAYIAKAAIGSAYGAAGSVVVVIVWVYYTAQIVFLGAEFTHVIGAEAGRDQNTARAPEHRPQPFTVPKIRHS
jgi:membrane protein